MEFDESKHSDSQDNDDDDAKLNKKDDWGELGTKKKETILPVGYRL